jgi:hypothetical protein
MRVKTHLILSTYAMMVVNLLAYTIHLLLPRPVNLSQRVCRCPFPYIVWLVDGSIHKVSPKIWSSMVKTFPNDNNKICFPSWLRNQQKVMYLHEGIYKKRITEWDLDTLTWRFSQHHRNETELIGVSLPNFCQLFQQYIDDGTLMPGWQGGG